MGNQCCNTRDFVKHHVEGSSGSYSGLELGPNRDEFSIKEPFTLVLVFPLPSATTAAEEALFDAARFREEANTSIMRDTIKGIASQKFIESKTLREARQNGIHLLQEVLHDRNGFETKTFISVHKDTLFMAVKMKHDEADAMADTAEYSLQLSDSSILKLGIDIDTSRLEIVPAYVRYDGHLKEYIRQYPTDTGGLSCYRSVDLIRLNYDAIMDHMDLNIWRQEGLLLHILPCHSRPPLKFLRQTWGRFDMLCNFNLPLDEIRNYFGEHVGFYFAFLQFLLKSLLFAVPAVILTLGYELWTHTGIMLAGEAGNAGVCFLVFMIVWVTVFLQKWKQREAEIANRWGMDIIDTSSVKEQVNVHFRGSVQPREEDRNSYTRQPDPGSVRFRNCLSPVVTVFAAGAAFALVLANIWLRQRLHLSHGVHFASLVSGVLLTIQIKVVDHVWANLAQKLTALEQHKLERMHMRAVSHKTFMVRFVNTYGAFFYIGFAEEYFQGCPEEGCFMQLRGKIIVVFFVYSFLSMMDAVIPYFSFQRSYQRAQKKNADEGIPFRPGLMEMQAQMASFTGVELDQDYTQIIFPLYFVLLFGFLFPPAVILALCVFAVQMRADAWKLVHVCQRPYPQKATSVGLWRVQVLEFMSWLAIFVNWTLLVFHVEPFRSADFNMQCLLFFVGQQLLVLMKWLVSFAIPADTKNLQLQKRRQQHQVHKVLDLIASTTFFHLHPVNDSTKDLDENAMLLEHDEYHEHTLLH